MFYAQQAPGPAEASGEQDVTAEFGQDGAGGAWQTSHHGGFAAFPHGAGLKPGGERIAKTTHQKQLRGASDHGGAHQDEERRARELEAERKRKLEQEQERENMNRFGCFWALARNFLLLNSAQSDVNISLDGSPIAFWFYLNISRIVNFLTL